MEDTILRILTEAARKRGNAPQFNPKPRWSMKTGFATLVALKARDAERTIVGIANEGPGVIKRRIVSP